MRKGVLSTGTTRSSRADGEIAYHYSYLQSGRAVRKGALSTGTTHSSRSSGEIAYHCAEGGPFKWYDSCKW